MIVARGTVGCRRMGRGSAGVEIETGVVVEQHCSRVRGIQGIFRVEKKKSHLRLIWPGNARWRSLRW